MTRKDETKEPKRRGPKKGDPNVIVKRQEREIYRCTCGNLRYAHKRPCVVCGAR